MREIYNILGSSGKLDSENFDLEKTRTSTGAITPSLQKMN